MDDFGTGYSSLSYLLGFRFNKIKIDRSLISAIERDRAGEAIVRAVVGMSRSLGIATVAEGVETERQLEFLQRIGCTEIQGFMYGHPMAEEELRGRYLVGEVGLAA